MPKSITSTARERPGQITVRTPNRIAATPRSAIAHQFLARVATFTSTIPIMFVSPLDARSRPTSPGPARRADATPPAPPARGPARPARRAPRWSRRAASAWIRPRVPGSPRGWRDTQSPPAPPAPPPTGRGGRPPGSPTPWCRSPRAGRAGRARAGRPPACPPSAGPPALAPPRAAAPAVPPPRPPRMASRARLHAQRVPRGVHPHSAAVGDLAGDDQPGDRGLDLALDRALERARPEHRVVAHAGQVLLGRLGDVDGDPALAEAPTQPL